MQQDKTYLLTDPFNNKNIEISNDNNGIKLRYGNNEQKWIINKKIFLNSKLGELFTWTSKEL